MSNLSHLTSFSSRIEADLTVAFLQSCEIQVLLKSDDAGGVNNAMSAASGIHLYVLDSQFDEAQKLLDEMAVES